MPAGRRPTPRSRHGAPHESGAGGVSPSRQTKKEVEQWQKGMLTDRDLVVKALAHGMDPATTKVGTLAQGVPVTIRTDASIDQALDLMREHAIKRLPVLDENRRLCGMISEADIATAVSAQKTGKLIGAIASEQPQHF